MNAATNEAPATWGPLAEPVDPNATRLAMRAQSILWGIECRDGDRYPLLPARQAADVIAWNARSRWVL